MATTAARDTLDRVQAIERAFTNHWSVFGGWPGASLHDEDGVRWFETPIAHLPYNAVIRTLIPPEADPDAVIRRVTGRFHAREVPFMWVVLPSDQPRDLSHRLGGAGLDLVEQATGMDLDLDEWQAQATPADVEIRAAGDDQTMRDYETLIRTYWSVPEEERELIERLNRHWTGDRSPGRRCVAYLEGRAVGKLFARHADLPVLSIYGVAVLPEARGRGIATALMTAAISEAQALGATRVVLHSSAMAQSLYRRMGFEPRCTLDVYATGPLFGTHHH
jgi:ribosomal protein S18 acetylase RimI-like enzyme